MQLLEAYAVTFGWAVVGSLAMSVGIVIALKLFAFSTREVDEWAFVKAGNIPIAIIIGSLIFSLGLVVSSAIRP